MGKIIAAYGGGFKPPTKGHFEVVKKAIENNPEIDEFIIYVGSKERNGVSQAESILIWDIYSKYLPMKVKIEPAKSPIGDIIRLGKNNPEDEVYFVIGGREGRQDDLDDIANRTKNIELAYPNMKVKVITTQDKTMSGTNARKAVKLSSDDFIPFLPDELTSTEKEEVFNILRPVVTEQLNENASYTKDINLIERLAQLTQHMLDKGMNIEPLPNLEFVDGDGENAREFLGKTAYYDPNTQTIVLYTEGRHPKDIVRSYAHEMIHHVQNLEGRLGDIQTTNTQEDDNLNDIEAEANLMGTMTFRNWTDSLNEGKKKDPFGINAYARELAMGLEEQEKIDYKIYCDMDGVLADFESGYEKLTGVDLKGEFQKGDDFWEPISKAGVGFWAGLKWMPDGQKLWDYLKPYKPDLLSAPSREDSSRIGKHVWVKHKIPGTKLILRYAKQKQELATPESILIDDRQVNIDQWEAAGGIGILHTSADNTISKLKELGL